MQILRQSFFTVLTPGALALAISACGSTAVSSHTTPAASSPENTSTAQQFSEDLETKAIACTPWSSYQAYATNSDEYGTYDTDVLHLLQMPSGFQNGCLFKAGFSLSTPIYILRDGLSLEQVISAGAADVSDYDGPIPWPEGQDVDHETLDNLIAQGDLLVYYQACTTTGGYQENCEGFPEDSPYLLKDDTVCLRGNCLQGINIPSQQLLALWDGAPESALASEQVAARSQYEQIPLNTLDVPLPLIGRNPEAIALELFGRTTLGEGQQPTTVTSDGYDDNYPVVILTNRGEADDSVGGHRYRLEFESFDNDQVKLIWVGQQRFCIRRNPPVWTTELCP
ncbi:hypothetical protein [Leptolyngbya sp. PCC 6406]|uniref:hypothetical protein n=1 Tax=Leptolyngbya sp. PCC 6406 TaxID=1173264 RepID=UPI0002ACB62A|nr:hypothetical protein [Leptolyngbya sp. PCC 6406]